MVQIIPGRLQKRRVREDIVAKRRRDPYRRAVKWWKIKNRAYSQGDDVRGELLNGDRRTRG